MATFFPGQKAFNYNITLKCLPRWHRKKWAKSKTEITVFFADDDEIIRKKVMKAKTDGGPQERTM
jgi:tryptophanyl-tRNA synthetase